MAREAPQAFSLLRSLGFELEEITGRYIAKPSRPDVIPGVTLMKVLADKIKESSGIKLVRDLYITEILKNEKKVYGVKGFNKTGEEFIIDATAIVLRQAVLEPSIKERQSKDHHGTRLLFSWKSQTRAMGYGIRPIFPLVIAEPGLPSQAVFSPPEGDEAD